MFIKVPSMSKTTKATFGGGCFWCTEALFQRVKGVTKVTSGYAGGTKKNPTYEDVKQGDTGYVEVVQIEYNPKEIKYSDLVKMFFYMHDPTSMDKQGNDVGSQYRSVIFYHNEKQKKKAEELKSELQTRKYARPIVTEIRELEKFYPAEQYHQNFYHNNQSFPYCRIVISPKMEKFIEKFSPYITD